jgi:enoyl-CoA hydratase/carnithine racemase
MSRTADDQQLLLDVSDGVATITFNNPHRHNALSNQAFGEDLPAMIAALQAREDVRVILFTGADGAFCGGTELDADGFFDDDPAETRALIDRVNRTVSLLHHGSIPSIAVVDGVAIGGGVGLATACDMRIATPRARFRLPYVRLGLSPDAGLLWTLPSIVGVPIATDLALTGRWLGAEEALRIGLVNQVVDDAAALAREWSAEIVASAPLAVALSREIIRDAPVRGFAQVVLQDEAVAHAQLLHHPDQDRYFLSYLASIGLQRNADGSIGKA